MISREDLRYFKVGSGQVTYFEVGKGELVLGIAGWPQSGFSLLKDPDHIHTSGYRLWAMNLPGWVGSSLLDDKLNHNYYNLSHWLAGVLDTMAIDRVNLLGVSNGAALCLYFSTLFPDRVKSIVANAPPVDYGKRVKGRRQFVFRLAEESADMRRFLFETMKQYPILTSALLGALPDKNDTFNQQAIELAKEVKLRAFFETLQQIVHSNLRETLRQVTVPVRIVVGDRDEIYADAIEAAALIPNAELVRVAGSHRLSIEDPRTFYDQAFNFFAQQPARIEA